MTEAALNPVDRIEVLTVIDNVLDPLLGSTPVAKRLAIGDSTWQGHRVVAPLFDQGEAVDTPIAEHGLSLLVSITSGPWRRTLLFDTGGTVGTLVHNLHALNVDLGSIETIILSHGHFDHTAGLNGLARELRPLPPLHVHPDVWLRRRITTPGRPALELPALNPRQLRAAGCQVVEERAPSLLFDDHLLLTGEIERTTDFEEGLPRQEAWRDGEWLPDPLVLDDQALVAKVRGKGLVVITGCGHAGVINTVRYAQRRTGVDRVHAIMGGFHLSTPHFESIISPTLMALKQLQPDIVAPAHCTGWRANHALSAAFGDSFVPGSVGTRYVFEGASSA